MREASPSSEVNTAAADALLRGRAGQTRRLQVERGAPSAGPRREEPDQGQGLLEVSEDIHKHHSKPWIIEREAPPGRCSHEAEALEKRKTAEQADPEERHAADQIVHRALEAPPREHMKSRVHTIGDRSATSQQMSPRTTKKSAASAHSKKSPEYSAN